MTTSGSERNGAAAPAAGDLDRLRELLLGEERRALAESARRLAEIERSQRSLPERLPPALEAMGGSPRVARALAGPVAQALGAAVRENRQTVVDTLFPVIGPLIRKSIAEALRNLVADLNTAIESSFTLRGMKWRMEAWRGGVPYAQVVLKHRLAYRVEHVFLIARESGLVLLHEAAPELPALDADAIAGMLTALGDFVGDSVGHGDGTALDSAQIGEYLVWVVQGPRANLAAFIRGVPPPALRGLLEQRLEEIHAALDGAPLDAARAAAWRGALQPNALVDEARAASGEAARTAPSRWPLLALLLAGLLAATAYFAHRERWQARVGALRARLAQAPGFVLTGLDSRPWRSLTVHGLLDPDAPPPQALLAAADLGDAGVRFDTSGYLSSADAVVARRAGRLLAPPPGVRLAVADGVLSIEGRAPAAWVAAAREHAGWIAGVRRVDDRLEAAPDPAAAARAELDALARELPGQPVLFTEDATPADGADAVVARLAASAQRAQALAVTAGVRVAFESVGCNDDVGSADANARVRGERARWLAGALAAHGVAAAPGTGPAAAAPGTNRRSAFLRLAIEAPR